MPAPAPEGDLPASVREGDFPKTPSTLEIVQMEVGLLQNFCEVIGCPVTKRAALVDPAFEVDRLLGVAAQHGWRIETILLTHSHADHVAGLDEAVAATGATVHCHPVEVERIRGLADKVQPVAHGDHVAVGAGTIQALHTPGHTPGCVCWYVPLPGAVVTGDVLFVGSCGSVSATNSDPRAMHESLHQVLGALPEETRLYPGHDYGPTPTSTLFWERLNNPALTAATFEDFCRHKRVRL